MGIDPNTNVTPNCNEKKSKSSVSHESRYRNAEKLQSSSSSSRNNPSTSPDALFKPTMELGTEPSVLFHGPTVKADVDSSMQSAIQCFDCPTASSSENIFPPPLTKLEFKFETEVQNT